jgi:hypothetical protein
MTESSIKHFKLLFYEPFKANITKILKMTSLFPRMIKEEQNEEELKSIMVSFKKEKSHSPYAWIVEFFCVVFMIL